ncbi:MAG: sulfatase-like hydrolase/transferase [Bacteroidales bacterium]
MKKRTILSYTSLSILPFALSAGNAKDKKETKPNIVIIYADDLGYGDVSCYGYSAIKTPNIDKLASEGIRFTDAHCTASTSTPSRYSLLTGEYAWRRPGTGIAAGDAATIIKPERYTLPKMMQQSGYKTAVVGKWHLGLGETTSAQDWNGHVSPGPQELGFDYSYIMAATGDRTPCVFMENGKVCKLDPKDPIQVSYTQNFPGEPTGKDNPELLRMLPSHTHNQSIVNGISRIGYMKGGKSALWVDENIGDSITAKALSFIDQNQNHPFFLYFATQDVHVPRLPHPRFVGKSGMGARGDAILEFDWIVGEVIAKLKKLKLDNNTLILLSSDNGPVVDDGYQDKAVELLGSHKPWGPFRGGKYSNFEAGTRVPQIVRWTGHFAPAVSSAATCHVDWYASFASLINAKLRADEAPDSFNKLKTLLGKSKANREYIVEQNINNNLAIVVDGWKYIAPSNYSSFNKDTKTELANNPKVQLYNLKTDPGEKNNIASQYPDKVVELKDLLEKVKKSEK